MDNEISVPSFSTMTFYDIRLTTFLSIEPNGPVLKFARTFFVITVLGFTRRDYRFGTLTNEKPVSISGIDKILPKGDCFSRSIMIGISQKFLNNFALDEQLNLKKAKSQELSNIRK